MLAECNITPQLNPSIERIWQLQAALGRRAPTQEPAGDLKRAVGNHKNASHPPPKLLDRYMQGLLHPFAETATEVHIAPSARQAMNMPQP